MSPHLIWIEFISEIWAASFIPLCKVNDDKNDKEYDADHAIGAEDESGAWKKQQFNNYNLFIAINEWR